MHKIIAVAVLLIILAFVNWSITVKEKHLAEGQVVYLELAPADSRSLMQGDYMALRFRLADDVYRALQKTKDSGRWRQDITASNGLAVTSLDDRNIAAFKRLYDNQPLSNNEILLRYRVRNGAVIFATNAFFFQEGHAWYYEPACYGQFRVDDKGELLLEAMYDKDLNKLGPEE